MRPTRVSKTTEPRYGRRFSKPLAVLAFAAFLVTLPSWANAVQSGESALPSDPAQALAPIAAPAPVEAAAPIEPVGAAPLAGTQGADAAEGDESAEAPADAGADETAEEASAEGDSATDEPEAFAGEDDAAESDDAVAEDNSGGTLLDFDDYFEPYDPYDTTGIADTTPEPAADEAASGDEVVAAVEEFQDVEDDPEIPRVLPVTVVVSGNASLQAAIVRNAIQSAVEQSERFEAINPFAHFDPVGVESRRDQQERGSDALRHGRASFDSLDFELGVEFFERSISAFEESALWDTFPSLIEAMTLRIIMRWSEDPGRTRADIEKLVALDPDVEFPFELTPGDLAAEVQRAKENLLGARRYSLDVNTTPISAQVYVNGKLEGFSPMTVRGLIEGEHYVTLVAPGYRVVQQRVAVGPGASHSVTLRHAERSAPYHTYVERIVEHFGDDSVLPHAQSLARLADANQVLVAGVTRERGRIRVDLHRVDQRDGHVHAIESAQFAETADDLAERVEAVALRVLARDRDRQSSGAPRTFKSDFALFAESITPSESTIRIGTAVLSGALLVTGATLGIIAHQQHNDFRAQPQTAHDLGPRISTGRATAITSDVLIGLGLAAGGTWAWLQFGRKDARQGDSTSVSNIDTSSPATSPSRDYDDPFASLPTEAPSVSSSSTPSTLPRDVLGSVSVFASPAVDGGVLGLKGSF